MRYFRLALAVAGLIAGVFQPALAQDYPSRPVRIVVPFAPWQRSAGRIVAAELTKRLGRPGLCREQAGRRIATRHRPGGEIAGRRLHAALDRDRDGLSALPAVKASVPYAIPDDFAFIASLTRIAVRDRGQRRSVPAKTIQELIAYAKANPGKLNYGSAGLGSAPHLGLALLSQRRQDRQWCTCRSRDLGSVRSTR